MQHSNIAPQYRSEAISEVPADQSERLAWTEERFTALNLL